MKYVSCLVVFLVSITSTAQQLSAQQLKVLKDIRWAAQMAEVPSDVLAAICFQESYLGQIPHATHMDGHTLSHGVCQVKLNTALYMDEVFKHKTAATAERLEDPRVNAFYAAKYLRYQLRRYGWNLKLSIDAYNKHIAKGTNTKYVRDVWAKLELLHNLVLALPDSR